MNLSNQWKQEARTLCDDVLTDLVREAILDAGTPSAMSSNQLGEVTARLAVLGERGLPCAWADYLAIQPEAAPAGPDWAVLGPRLASAMRSVEGLLYEAQSDIPVEMRAKRDVLAALEIVRANIMPA